MRVQQTSELPSFDTLLVMVEESPESLETLRREMSQTIIDNAPGELQPRLQAQMSHIERVIGLGKNPNHTNVLLMKELNKQFSKFSTAVSEPIKKTDSAEILPFTSPHR
ncbi:DUF3135 domain-containing protein [Aliivibrio kagoshimensis]|jgi:hypothetical protein|uniref:DUF3135 domain-containing protein n=1 Tax=Aliivibrio kagoshimensis TaxID=2910230 RepID=UPI003D0A70C3